jgi:hypothetical protein
MTRPAEVQVARRDGWLSNDRIRLTGLLRKGPAPAGPFYVRMSSCSITLYAMAADRTGATAPVVAG